MSYKVVHSTTYEPARIIQPIYSGGDVVVDETGSILASCLGEDLVLTDLHTGQRLAYIDGDGEVLTTFGITPSADFLIICSRSLSLRIFSLQKDEDESPQISATLVKTLKPHKVPVITIAIDQSGSLFATGAADGTIKVWDTRGAFQTHTFYGHSGVVSALRFFQDPIANDKRGQDESKSRASALQRGDAKDQDSPQPQVSLLRLASGGEDAKVRIWKLQQRKSAAILESHVSVIRDIHYDAGENILLTVSRDKTAIIWDAKTWKLKKIVPILERVEAAGFLNDGKLFFTAGELGLVKIWDALRGSEQPLSRLTPGKEDAVIKAMYTPHKQTIVTVHADQSLLFHSVKAQDTTEHFMEHGWQLETVRRITGTHDEIIDLAFMTPQKDMLALATNSEDIRLVSVAPPSDGKTSEQGSYYFGADVASLKGHSEIIISISADDSGMWLATGAKDNTARLWHIEHGNKIYEHYATFTGHTESIGAVALPLNDVQGSKELGKPVENLPRFLLTGSNDRTVKRWIIPKTALGPVKAEYTRKAHDKDINALATSPFSAIFASASQDRTVKIWSMEGETQGILRGHKRGVWSVVFAPKGTSHITDDSGASASTTRGLVITGSGDRTVKIWSLNDFSCIRTFEGHTNNVLKVLWLPALDSSSDEEIDGGHSPQQASIASAGADGLVKVWSPFSGECLTTLDNHSDRVWALASNATDGTLVSGGGDGVVTFWKNTSKQTAEERTKTQVERVEQDQELQNCERQGKWREGIVLALQLNHPARLLGIFQKVTATIPKEESSISGVLAVDRVIASLADEQLLTLLMRVRDWNTNARTAPVAQRILNVIVKSYSPDRLARLEKRRGGREVISALKAYTERHYLRMRELEEESWIVEFLLGEMDQLGVKENDRMAMEIDTQDEIMV